MKENRVSDEEYFQFQNDVLKYIDSHPEYKEMFNFIISKQNRIKRALWGRKLFYAWKSNSMEWFLNHSLIEYEK